MIELAKIDEIVQNRLQNSVGSPLTTSKRVLGYNDAIQVMQGLANFNPTKRVKIFDYLNGESDYSILNTLGISDYKAIKTIRKVNDNIRNFDHSDERDLSNRIGGGSTFDAFTVEERDNDNVLRITHGSGKQRKSIAPLDSLTEDGTWAVIGADGSNLTVDTNRFKQGAGSFNFDLGAYSSGYGGIKNTTLTALDLTDFNTIGHWRVWADLQKISSANLALISGFTLIWGSDTSNYWSVTVTTSINAGSFQADWNRLDFDWASATETGSPDVENIDYIELRANTSAGFTATTDIRFDDLVLIEPEPMEIVYYSTYFVSKSGVLQEEFSTSTVDNTEELLLPSRHRDNFVRLCIDILEDQIKPKKRTELEKQRDLKQLIKPIVEDIGGWIIRESNKLDIYGNSSGRVESKMW